MVKGREKGFLSWHRLIMVRGKVSTSAHLWGTDMSFMFNRRRIGAGGKKYA
jgi:hypothetical protein